MGAFDEDAIFGAPKAKTAVLVLGESLDALSAPELAERIEGLRREIERLEAAIRAREATRLAAAAIFKKLRLSSHSLPVPIWRERAALMRQMGKTGVFTLY